MAQHDYVLSNQSGLAFRSDLNNALAAIVSQNSGAAQPSVTYAYMPWADTTTGLFKIRNAANNGWITLYQLDGEWSTIALENGTAASPSLYFKDSGTDTGAYSPGTDQFAISTGGVERARWGNGEVVFNDAGNDVDFRVEGDTKPNLFRIDAGTDKVIIDGLTHPSADGTAGQSLVTNGSGVLSFASRMTATGPAFGAYASTATNTTNATFTKIVFATEEFDTANCFDNASNYRFTPNVAGYYQINGAVGGGLSTLIASIWKNGAELKRGTQAQGFTLDQSTVSSLVYLNGTTDYVELYWYQASGGTANNATGQERTWFNGFLARPA